MPHTDVVICERTGAVAEVVLNRPRAHNAIDPEMACRLAELFDALAADPDVRAVVLAGNGPSFCAGGDLRTSIPLLSGTRAPQNEWESKVAADPSLLARAVRRAPAFDKPLIAAVNGACLAAGTELLVSTDIRIAGAGATFGLPEARHGLIPFAGALARLAAEIPYCHAMQLLLTAEPISAAEALRIGLVNEVLPAAEVLPRARAVAHTIASNGPLAVRKIKEIVLTSVGRRLEEAFALEDEARRDVLATRDAAEGPKAFFERRVAIFEGR